VFVTQSVKLLPFVKNFPRDTVRNVVHVPIPKDIANFAPSVSPGKSARNEKENPNGTRRNKGAMWSMFLPNRREFGRPRRPRFGYEQDDRGRKKRVSLQASSQPFLGSLRLRGKCGGSPQKNSGKNETPLFGA
jgi:hypothetical protein